MKKIGKLLLSRPAIITLLLLSQLCFLIISVAKFSNQFVWYSALIRVFAMIAVLQILRRWTNPAYKTSWITVILISPVFGFLLYCLFGNRKLGRQAREKMNTLSARAAKTFFRKNTAQPYIEQSDPDGAFQSRYLERYAGYPLFRGTETKYFSNGETFFSAFLQELSHAKSFIFLEYFIISHGIMWDETVRILKEKSACGVDVRIIYDDFGCFMSLSKAERKQLMNAGIKVHVFNPIVPVLNSGLNNRDHRKICVIDGNVGYTGGINIADEYINVKRRFGYWKDVAVELRGEGVWGLTAMFLTMWGYLTGVQENIDSFRPSLLCPEAGGFVQPYAGSPLETENISENVYLNMISRAKRYLYIMTPYLVLDNELRTALCNAAKCGVDVRILTPGIPDKKTVYAVTRANYEPLVNAGIRIFEYSPGFIHAKTFLCDDSYGVVGTVNLDFRSLFLHFECAVFMCDTSALEDMKKDFLKTARSGREITADHIPRRKGLSKLWQDILTAFSPLM